MVAAPQPGLASRMGRLLWGGGRRTPSRPAWPPCRLNLSGNRIGELPEQIGDLRALVDLDLGSNSLSALPASIGSLTRLRFLNAMSNQLTALPPGIGGCTALHRCGLKNNQLTALPPSIGQLASLVELYLTGRRQGREERGAGEGEGQRGRLKSSRKRVEGGWAACLPRPWTHDGLMWRNPNCAAPAPCPNCCRQSAGGAASRDGQPVQSGEAAGAAAARELVEKAAGASQPASAAGLARGSGAGGRAPVPDRGELFACPLWSLTGPCPCLPACHARRPSTASSRCPRSWGTCPAWRCCAWPPARLQRCPPRCGTRPSWRG